MLAYHMTGFESLPQCAPQGTKDVLELLVNVNVNVQSTITNLVSIEISPVKLRGSCGARAGSLYNARDDVAMYISRMSKPLVNTVGNRMQSKLLTCRATTSVSDGENDESIGGTCNGENNGHSSEHGDGGGLGESRRGSLESRSPS